MSAAAATREWVLAIDLGTGGPKTGAVALDGELLSRHAASVSTSYLPGGGAEQDPDEWWARIVEGARAIIGSGAIDPAGLAGVGLTGQWASTVPVGAGGRPAGPCLLWSDTRGGPFSARALGGPVSLFGYSPGNIAQWLRYTGGAPSPHGADPLGHELYLRNREPEVYARTETLMEPLDYLGLRLTGRRAATPASMIASWLTDNRPGAKPRYVPTLLRRSGRDHARLPELLPTGSVTGPLCPEAAVELGLPAGAPVVGGVPDLHTACIGSGAVAPYEAHVTISSTAWIGCDVPWKRTDVLHQIASVPGIGPGRYVVANNHETAGLCLAWVRRALAGRGTEASYDELCRLAEAAPAGAGGVLFTPWLNGERSPVEDRALRAAFLNVSMDTDASALVRAVLEGVALNARWLLDAVERFLRRKLPSLRILGGGAESDLWCQIHADVLGRPIVKVAEPTHANLRGAGLYAAIALGRLTLDGVSERVPIERTFDPDPAAQAVYEGLYGEYRRLYARLHPLYDRLNRGPGSAA